MTPVRLEPARDQKIIQLLNGRRHPGLKKIWQVNMLMFFQCIFSMIQLLIFFYAGQDRVCSNPYHAYCRYETVLILSWLLRSQQVGFHTAFHFACKYRTVVTCIQIFSISIAVTPQSFSYRYTCSVLPRPRSHENIAEISARLRPKRPICEPCRGRI